MVFSSIPVYLDPPNWHQVRFSLAPVFPSTPSIFTKTEKGRTKKKQIQKIYLFLFLRDIYLFVNIPEIYVPYA